MPTSWHWQKCSSPRRRRRSALLGSSLILGLFFLIIYHHASLRPSAPNNVAAQNDRYVGEAVPPSPLQKDQAKFWRSVYQIVLNNDPQCQNAPDVVVPQKLDIAYQDDHVHNRPDIMWMDEPDIVRMRTAHANFIRDIHASDLKLVYNPGSRGIITTVSDSQLPVLLTTLRMLRQTKSILPVEVFLWQTTPYTDHLCSTTLSSLNATCVYLSRIFTEASTGVGIDSYQHKIFAILFSSFDELLFLDSDCWPVTNPDPLFNSQPFTNTGLVLWPDFWYASESPYFFSIAKIDDPPKLADRAATEAGELMYSKSRHELGIMLATYYNYYGPEYYYPLQSQGAPGQGDKETFGLAAMAVGEEFYSVKTMVTALGRGDSSGQWLGSAMVQYDPIADYQVRKAKSGRPMSGHDDTATKPLKQIELEELTYQGHAKSPPSIVQAAVSFSNSDTNMAVSPLQSRLAAPKPLFIHANHPKFDPRTVFDEETNGAHTPTRDTNGTNVRPWGMTPEVAIARFGYDVEERFWTVIFQVACIDIAPETPRNGKNDKEIEVCNTVKRYVREMFPNIDLLVDDNTSLAA